MLEKLLKKAGVKSYLELNSEERETYKLWESQLQGRKITDDDVTQFLRLQLEDTETKLITKKLNDREDTFLKMKLEMIKSLQRFLNGPIIEKEIAQRQIGAIVESKIN